MLDAGPRALNAVLACTQLPGEHDAAIMLGRSMEGRPGMMPRAHDAGPRKHGAGQQVHDAGLSARGAGKLALDTGPREDDAGPRKHDAMQWADDAGLRALDTGPNVLDAGPRARCRAGALYAGSSAQLCRVGSTSHRPGPPRRTKALISHNTNHAWLCSALPDSEF